MTATSASHISVMLAEILAALAPADGEVHVDGTFGAGGYTRGILDAANCRVIAIDRDADAVARTAAFEKEYGARFSFRRGCFGDACALVDEAIDGFVIDIGVSSMQIDEAERGFSFRTDGPLDMRMDRTQGLSAADIVNTYEEGDLADIIYQYGEERHSRRVARAIVRVREEQGPITRTLQLADIVRSAVPRAKNDQIDRATRTFQALRIAVNAELDELRRGLEAAEALLKDGGRLVVVSFHSLEDTIVKRFLQERAGRTASVSRHLPDVRPSSPAPTFTLPSSKAVFPSDAESSANPRSRSARLRYAIRTSAPAWKEVA